MPLKKEATLRVRPTENPDKTSQQRDEALKEYKFKECDILFDTAVLKSDHKSERSTKLENKS